MAKRSISAEVGVAASRGSAMLAISGEALAAKLAQGSADLWLVDVPLSLLVLQFVIAFLKPSVIVWPGESAWPRSRLGASRFTTSAHEAHGCPRALRQMLGRWKLVERNGMEEFMEALGYHPILRAGAVRSGQEQVLAHDTDWLRVITSDMRGRSQIDLPLHGPGALAHDGDGGIAVCRAAYVEGNSVVVTEKIPGEKDNLSICRRFLQPDGRMCIEVQKRIPGSDQLARMSTIYRRVDEPD